MMNAKLCRFVNGPKLKSRSIPPVGTEEHKDDPGTRIEGDATTGVRRVGGASRRDWRRGRGVSMTWLEIPQSKNAVQRVHLG
jgi:hypothetical protein